jgi:antitoxin component YwqK of YwqJK toxin-antitoxin module
MGRVLNRCVRMRWTAYLIGFFSFIPFAFSQINSEVAHLLRLLGNEKISADSTASTYYPSGQVRMTNVFLANQRIRTVGYDSIGQLAFDLPFQKGKQHGVGYTWYPNGTVRTMSVFFEGSGVYFEYHPDGLIAKTAEFLDNKRVGFYTEYWPNGAMRVRLNMDIYKQNTMSFYDTGTMESEGVLVGSKIREGLWHEWYENGKLRSKGYYKELSDTVDFEQAISVKCGIWEYFDENGTLTLSEDLGSW